MLKSYLPQGTEEYHQKPQLWQWCPWHHTTSKYKPRALPLTSPFFPQHELLYCIGVSFPTPKTGVCTSIWYSLPPRIWISSEPLMYVQPRIFCAVAMLSTLTPWHSLRHGPINTHQPHFSSLDKRSVNGTQMVFTHTTNKSHLSVHKSCQLLLKFQWGKIHGFVADFFLSNIVPRLIMRVSRDLDT